MIVRADISIFCFNSGTGAAGNITKKTDLGNATFNYTTGTNRLASITFTGASNYSPGDQSVTYTSFDKVNTLALTDVVTLKNKYGVPEIPYPPDERMKDMKMYPPYGK